MKMLRIVLAALSLSLLPSCLQSEILLKLNKDGSGTISEKTVLSSKILSMIPGGEGKGASGLFSEEVAKEKAKNMGIGVVVKHCESIDGPSGKGCAILYQFSNINQVKLSGDVDMGSLLSAQEGGNSNQKTVNIESLTFDYSYPNLKIHVPQPKGLADKNPSPSAVSEKPNALSMMLMKKMIADTKIEVKVQIDSGIDSSTAKHHSETSQRNITAKHHSETSQRNITAAMRSF